MKNYFPHHIEKIKYPSTNKKKNSILNEFKNKTNKDKTKS